MRAGQKLVGARDDATLAPIFQTMTHALVMAAVRQYAGALQYAAESLQTDEDVIRLRSDNHLVTRAAAAFSSYTA